MLYKIDRLSRSLFDFAKLMEVFDEHDVAFVSIIQLVNSATSMDRLMLNVLLSFAQFERKIIAERTRAKIAAARPKGKWSGDMPLLGYDVDPHGGKLLVNVAEAVRVRAIFELYLKHQALVPVVQELERRGWRTKGGTTRAGTTRGGVAFTRTNLYHLLTCVAYVGRIQYKTETHPGEHQAIVDTTVWEQAQGAAAAARPARPAAAVVQRAAATLAALRRLRFLHESDVLLEAGNDALPLLPLRGRHQARGQDLPGEGAAGGGHRAVRATDSELARQVEYFKAENRVLRAKLPSRNCNAAALRSCSSTARSMSARKKICCCKCRG